MEEPRPEKVAVVEEVRGKFTAADAVVFTEYRGLTVRDLAVLRNELRPAGGEYKVYKNTLVRRATNELELDFDETLVGPVALAFVGQKPDGTPGDAVLVAKALKAFAKTNPLLVIKGGLLGDQVLDDTGVQALADVAPREELLARLAGGLAAPLRNFAGLLQAVPQSFAYALQALIEQGGAPGAPAPSEAPAADDTAAAPATTDEENETSEAVAAGDDTAEAPAAAPDENETEENETTEAVAAGDETAPAAEEQE